MVSCGVCWRTMVCLLVMVSTPLAQERDYGHRSDSREETTGTEHHSRQKRVLWITNDGRLALPPGTTMVISPSLSMPFVRYPPDGFFSNMTISLPFTINFDKLGLTDNENPYGVLPPVLARSMGRAAGSLLADYIGQIMSSRGKRSTAPKEPPPQARDAFHGGERALLYTAVEDLLSSFGMDGKACLLRAICEVHAHPLHNFGLLGEMLKLFFTASKSPYADFMEEYVRAEKAGNGLTTGGPGECWPYLKDCPKSLFLPSHNAYSEEANNNIHLEETNDVEETEESVPKDDSSKITVDFSNTNFPRPM